MRGDLVRTFDFHATKLRFSNLSQQDTVRQIVVGAAVDFAASVFLSEVDNGTDDARTVERVNRLAAAAFQAMRLERDRLIAESN